MKTKKWLLIIGSLHLFFIAATTISPFLPNSLRYGLFHHVDLGVEMNVAAWWSGMWLLWAALLAFEMASSRNQERFGWLILGGIFAALSLDEIGSLHERAGGIREALPAIVAIGVALALGLAILYRRGHKRLIVGLILSISLFGLVVLLERLEHRLLWPEWTRGPRAGVEEGLELLGVFGLVWFLNEARNLPSTGGLFAVFPAISRLPGIQRLLLTGLGLHVILTLWSVLNPVKSTLGAPPAWYPTAVFFMLFSASIYEGRLGFERKGLANLALSAWFLLNSVGSMYLIAPRTAGSLLSSGALSGYLSVIFALQFILLLPFLVLAGRTAKPGHVLVGYVLALLFLGMSGSNKFATDPLAVDLPRQLSAGGYAFLIGGLWFVSFQGEFAGVIRFNNPALERNGSNELDAV